MNIPLRPKHLPPLLCLFALATYSFGAAAATPRSIETKGKHESSFTAHPVRTLADLPAVPVDTDLDEYGGLKSARGKATRFFRTEKINGRWWLVDPVGGLFLSRSMNSVNMGKTKGVKDALKQKFRDEAGWARAATAMLRENGFNGTGAWSDYATLRAP